MKNLLLTYIFVLLAISTTNAQFFNQADVEIYKNDIAKQAKSLVKEHLDLTADQAEIFWPLYDKYEVKYSVALNEELKVLEDYLMNYYMLSDEKAEELMNKSIKLKNKKLNLQKEYIETMSKELPVKLVGKFFQIHNRIDLMISQQRSEKIPLVRDQDKN
jgi:hypothetical protein